MNEIERMADFHYHAERTELSRQYNRGHREAMNERLRDLHAAACRHLKLVQETESLGRMGPRDAEDALNDEDELERAGLFIAQLDLIMRRFWR